MPDQSSFQVLTGIENYEKIIREILQSTKQEFKATFTLSLGKIFTSTDSLFIAYDFLKSGVRGKIIFPQEYYEALSGTIGYLIRTIDAKRIKTLFLIFRHILLSKKFECKILEDTHLNMCFSIFDNKTVGMAFPTINRENITVLLLNNPEAVKSFEAHFENLWENSSNFDAKQCYSDLKRLL